MSRTGLRWGRSPALPRARRDPRPQVEEVFQDGRGPAVAVSLSPVTATMGVDQLADAFAGMDASAQALFLVRAAERFDELSGAEGRDWQIMTVGRKLGRSPGAVELLRTLVEAADEAMVREIMES